MAHRMRARPERARETYPLFFMGIVTAIYACAVGSSAFTQHLRSGHAALMLAFLLLIAVEGLAVHFLLHPWSVVGAWTCTIGSCG